MNLATYALLQKSIEHLQLAPSTTTFLRDLGFETIEQLLDADISELPLQIGDELYAATVGVGLREPYEAPAPDGPQSSDDAWFLACGAGSPLDRKGSLHVGCYETTRVDWEALWRAPWLAKTRRLFVEAWRTESSSYVDE
ncbi:MAG: hypothetical protein ACI9MC_002970, partial [Kiritimatiellia bacterium]